MPVYQVRAASHPGSRHRTHGEGNQDAYAHRIFADGVALAVCDGAGSREHSRVGADLAARAAVDFLGELDWSAPFAEQVARFLGATRAALADRAAADGFPPGELACTLVAAAIGDRGLRALQLGDGFVVAAATPGADFTLLFDIQKGEYANETRFVTDADAETFAQTLADDLAPDFIALSSDGLERQAVRLVDGVPHRPFFDYLARVAAAPDGDGYLRRFLAMPALDDVTDDDRTLVCAVRRRPAGTAARAEGDAS